MKKNLLLLSLLFIIATITSEARRLTPTEALARISTTGPAKARAAIAQTPRLAARDSISDTYYIFSTAEHSLVVSADDCAPALLGYTDTPTENASTLPPQMRWWLGEYARQIEWGREHHEAAAPHKSEPADRTPIEALCTAHWGQDYPYNFFCPSINGELTVTGCVATAIAQIMYYHRYPQQGFGSKCYEENGKELNLDFTKYKFNWDKMLDKVDGYSDTDAIEEIARLMKVCGISVEMDYNTSNGGGSGARDDLVPSALINHFGYDQSLHLEYRDYYQAETWNNMIYASLANGPVYYGGTTLAGGGHAFVCDGYDSDGYFHINWGWNGDYNGFFLLSALNPEGQGIGGSAGGYNFRQSAVLGIRPPFEGSVPARPYMAVFQNMTCSTSGMLVRFGGGFYNMSGIEGHFTIRMNIEKPDGEVSLSEHYYEDDVPSFIGASVLDFSFPGSYQDGVYRIRPVYCLDNDGDWTNFKVPLSSPVWFNVTLADGKLKLGGDFVFSGEAELTTVPENNVVRWYNLNGTEVDPSQLIPGLYIKANGSKRSLKVVR